MLLHNTCATVQRRRLIFRSPCHKYHMRLRASNMKLTMRLDHLKGNTHGIDPLCEGGEAVAQLGDTGREGWQTVAPARSLHRKVTIDSV